MIKFILHIITHVSILRLHIRQLGFFKLLASFYRFFFISSKLVGRFIFNFINNFFRHFCCNKYRDFQKIFPEKTEPKHKIQIIGKFDANSILRVCTLSKTRSSQHLYLNYLFASSFTIFHLTRSPLIAFHNIVTHLFRFILVVLCISSYSFNFTFYLSLSFLFIISLNNYFL